MKPVYHTVTDFNKLKILIFTLSFLTQSIPNAKLYYIFEKFKAFFLFFQKKGYNKRK